MHLWLSQCIPNILFSQRRLFKSKSHLFSGQYSGVFPWKPLALFHHVTPNRRWQIINRSAFVCVCVCGEDSTDWCACHFFAMNCCCFFPGAIFTLPCQPFHTELGHEGSEFRSGCGALMQLKTLLLMQSEETSKWLNPQDTGLGRGVGGENYRTCMEKSVLRCLPFKKNSPDSCANSISSAFVVEMRCKDGH